MLDIIIDNPYRVLGVWSNATNLEVLHNARKLKAFTNVGHSCQLSTDLTVILPQVRRNTESIERALSSLSSPLERTHYGLFWFVVDNDTDEKAIISLNNGDLESAKAEWDSHESFSSLLNRAILALCNHDIKEASTYYSKLFEDDYYREALIPTISHDSIDISKNALYQVIIDTLRRDTPVPLLCDYWVESPINACLFEQSKEYYCNKLNQLINGYSLSIKSLTVEGFKNEQSRLKNRQISLLPIEFSFYNELLSKTEVFILKSASYLGCLMTYCKNLARKDPHKSIVPFLRKHGGHESTKKITTIDNNIRLVFMANDGIKVWCSILSSQLILLNRENANKLTVSNYEDVKKDYTASFEIQDLTILLFIKEIISSSKLCFNKIFDGMNQYIYVERNTTIDEILPNYSKSSFSIFDPFPNKDLQIYNRCKELLLLIDRVSALVAILETFEINQSDFMIIKESIAVRKAQIETIIKSLRIIHVDSGCTDIKRKVVLDFRNEKELYNSIKTVRDCFHYMDYFPDGLYKNEILRKKSLLE